MNTRVRQGSVSVTTEVEVDIDICDVIQEMDSDDLLKKLKKRGHRFNDQDPMRIPESGDELKRLLCDALGVSYHTEKNKLMNLLNDRI
jgi:hypothetical protein